MIEIPLTQGQVAIVDDEDADLAQFKWNAKFVKIYANGGKWVARRGVWIPSQKKIVTVFMHRVILARKVGRDLLHSELTDHIDRNPLHNWRSNLRVATKSLNALNTGMYRHNTSGHRGIRWSKREQRWLVKVVKDGKIHLKRCLTFDEATDTRKRLIAELYGDTEGIE